MVENSHGTSSRSAAIIAGVLLIFGMVAGILSVVPVIDGPGYLEKASGNETQVLLGAFFQLLMVISYVGIPISLFPILVRHNKSLAVGSVSFGIIAGVFIIGGVIALSLLLALSREFAQAASQDLSYFQTLGELLRTARDLVNHLAMTLAFGLAMLLFNFVSYQARLVPRWLSGWGVVGSVLTVLASLLFMVGLIGIDSAYMALNGPIALQELVLAIWLMIRGLEGR